MSHRDVDGIDVMISQDPPHLRDESIEVASRDEIFLQDVRLLVAGLGLELADIVARLIVAPSDRMADEDERVDHVLPEPIAAESAGDHRVSGSMAPGRLILWQQAVGNRQRLSGQSIGNDVNIFVGRWIHVGIVKNHRRVVPDLLPEKRRI